MSCWPFLFYSFIILLCILHSNAQTTGTTLYSRTIILPFSQTCMAARMEYVGRNPVLAKKRIDAVAHYERRGHGDGLTWMGSLCDFSPIYQNDTICQCPDAISYYIMDNPIVLPSEAYTHYLSVLDTLARVWYCNRCIFPDEDNCVDARYDYLVRYNMNISNTVEPTFHYLTLGKSLGNTWNTSLCRQGTNTSTIILMNSTTALCPAGEEDYIERVPDYNDFLNGGETSAVAHYDRYSLEFGAYWNAELCTDYENECATGNNNCTEGQVCQNVIGREGSFTCSCPEGYEGVPCRDIDECTSPNLCNANATCVNQDPGFYCACNAGFDGDGINNCTDRNECALGTHNCTGVSICHNTYGGFECLCPIDYHKEGPICVENCKYPNTLCSDQRCVTMLQETCAEVRPCVFPSIYRCASGECVDTPQLCATPTTCREYESICWDGSCKRDEDLCPILPECPAGHRRCSDGRCNEICGEAECDQVCSDGMCQLESQVCTVNWNGCPLTTPFRCPNGSCAVDVNVCLPGNFTVPHMQRAPSTSIWIPIFSREEDEPMNLKVVSEDNNLIANFTVPYATFDGANITMYINQAADSIVYKAGEIPYGKNFDPSTRFLSTALDVLVVGAYNPNFWPPLEVTFNILPTSLNISTFCLGMINSTNNWECHSPLTKVGSGLKGRLSQNGKIALIFSGNVKHSYDRERAMGIYIFAVLISVYCVGLIFGSLRDRKIFIEIVAQTIKRENSVAFEVLPPAPKREPSQFELKRDLHPKKELHSKNEFHPNMKELNPKIKDLNPKLKELSRRGLSMPNIELPDELRARHMALTKHAVVLSTEMSVDNASGDRTTRAMTFDAPYSPFFPATPLASLLSAPSPNIRPEDFKPRSRTRGASMARPSPAEFGESPDYTPGKSKLKKSMSTRNYALTRKMSDMESMRPSPLSLSNNRNIDANIGLTAAAAALATAQALAPITPASSSSSSSSSSSAPLGSSPLGSSPLGSSPPFTSSHSSPPRASALRPISEVSGESSSQPVNRGVARRYPSNRNFASSRDLGLGKKYGSSRGFRYEEHDNSVTIEMEDMHNSYDNINNNNFNINDELGHISSPTPLVGPDLGIEPDHTSSTTEDPTTSTTEDPEQMPLQWEESVRVQLGGQLDVKKLSKLELLKLKHVWVSIWNTKRTSKLTCVEQLTILLCMALAHLGISAPFFENDTHFDMGKVFKVALSAGSLVWIITIAITLLFQNVKKTNQLRGVFGISFFICCGSIILGMMYSWNYVSEKASFMWLVANVFACLQDLLINQPIKVLVTAMAYSHLPEDHWLVLLL